MELVLQKLGIRLEIEPDISYDGTIRKNCDGKYVITLPSKFDSSNKRARFTLAHELGHLFLHYILGESTELVYTRLGTNQVEYDANEFAANFLMPTKLFKEVAASAYDSAANTYDLSKIADQFGVSVDAAKTRGRFLGLFVW